MDEKITKISDLIDPEVMADGISAKLPAKIRVLPFAQVDDSLMGVAGDTITIPKFAYIGDAEDVAEGVEAGTTVLKASTTKATVKKAMKVVEITDEALLSAHGNPAGEAENQIALSIASKIDSDAMNALSDEKAEGRLMYAGEEEIGYAGVVKAVDKFEEEVNGEKAIFVHPNQVTTLRLDPNFISSDKYGSHVMVSGEIGMVANARVVPSKKVKLNEAGTHYLNPIIRLNTEEETDDEAPAIKIYRKRAINVEVQRYSKKRTTEISADEFYTAVVGNDSKVVLAKFVKPATSEVPEVSDEGTENGENSEGTENGENSEGTTQE